MRNSRFIAAPLIALLAACGTPKPAPTAAPASPASGPAASVPIAPALRATLASEQVRLSELFRGTPVTFAMQQDGSLRATVPRRYSFDAGEVKVKPPLAAVLDRLAKAQLAATSRLRVSAPADPQARGSALARDRAFSVRDYLQSQGIASTRLQAAGVAQTDLVEIVVTESAR